MAWVDLHEGILEEFSDRSITDRLNQIEWQISGAPIMQNSKEYARLVGSDIRAIRDYRAKHDPILKTWNAPTSQYEKLGERRKRISDDARSAILSKAMTVNAICRTFNVSAATVKRIRQNAKQVV
jgi:hypothetical protein